MGGGQGLGELGTRIAGAANWEKIQVHLFPLRTFESSCHSNETHEANIRQNTKQKNFFCGFEPAKMHCEFTYTTNAFQDES